MNSEERAEIEAADLHSLQADAQHNADVWTLNRWRVQLLGALVEAEADRDRARDAAVALEQENAEMDTAAVRAISAEAKAVRELEQKVARVRELHAKFVCGCGDDHQIGCKECRDSEYPCPTIRALDGGER